MQKMQKSTRARTILHIFVSKNKSAKTLDFRKIVQKNVQKVCIFVQKNPAGTENFYKGV